MTRSNIGIYRIQRGDTTVTALNDGQFEASPDWVGGLDKAGVEAALHSSFRPFPPRITLNAFLLEKAGRTILVDAGAGSKFGPNTGRVGRHLQTLGVAPESIDTIVLTHAHTDHVGGLTDDDGAPLFPRAELIVSGIEEDFWRDDAALAQAPEGAKGTFQVARAALDAYKDRTRRFGDGEEVVPGVRARALPGHTPGHSGFMIGEGAQGLLIWADVVHLPGIQFERPDIGMVFDSDPAQANETRRKILEEVAADRIMIAGMHLDFPTFAHVRRQGDRFEVVPHVWMPEA